MAASSTIKTVSHLPEGEVIPTDAFDLFDTALDCLQCFVTNNEGLDIKAFVKRYLSDMFVVIVPHVLDLITTLKMIDGFPFDSDKVLTKTTFDRTVGHLVKIVDKMGATYVTAWQVCQTGVDLRTFPISSIEQTADGSILVYVKIPLDMDISLKFWVATARDVIFYPSYVNKDGMSEDPTTCFCGGGNTHVVRLRVKMDESEVDDVTGYIIKTQTLDKIFEARYIVMHDTKTSAVSSAVSSVVPKVQESGTLSKSNVSSLIKQFKQKNAVSKPTAETAVQSVPPYKRKACDYVAIANNAPIDNFFTAVCGSLFVRKGNNVVCMAGLSTMATLLSQAISEENTEAQKKLAGLLGADDVEGMMAAMDGQMLHNADAGVFGGAIVMAPTANPAYTELMKQMLGEVTFMEKFDKEAANDFVTDKTNGLITSAGFDDVPKDLVNIAASVVTAFASEWDIKGESEDVPFNKSWVPGIKFSGMQRVVKTDMYKAVSIPFTNNDVFGFFIQPALGVSFDPYQVMNVVMRTQSDKRYDVYVPNFEFETEIDYKTEVLGELSLPNIAPDCVLSVFKQKTVIKCDENGVVAASATSMAGATRGGGPPVVYINGPFLFIVAKVDWELGIVPSFVAFKRV
jgi:hypothetical protein